MVNHTAGEYGRGLVHTNTVEGSFSIFKRPLMTNKGSQSDKFKEAAREHDADEDETRWEERLKKVVKAKASGEPSA